MSNLQKIHSLSQNQEPQQPLWKKYCSHLDQNFKLSELRFIARKLKIPNASKLRKNEICQLLSQSFIRYQSRKKKFFHDILCSNKSSLNGHEFGTMNPYYFIKDEKGYCHYLLDIKDLIDLGINLSPYTQQYLDEIKTSEGKYLLDIYKEKEDLLYELLNPDIIDNIHKS